MLIVLEGCDGTGKTTLAKSLQAIIGGEIIHCTTKTPNTYEFFESIIDASRGKTNIIADRFCYGQFVYQDLQHRKLTREELYMLEVLMLDAGAKVVHVTADIEEITKRLEHRQEATLKPIEKIVSGFHELFKNSMLPIIEWTTSRPIEALKVENSTEVNL